MSKSNRLLCNLRPTLARSSQKQPRPEQHRRREESTWNRNTLLYNSSTSSPKSRAGTPYFTQVAPRPHLWSCMNHLPDQRSASRIPSSSPSIPQPTHKQAGTQLNNYNTQQQRWQLRAANSQLPLPPHHHRPAKLVKLYSYFTTTTICTMTFTSNQWLVTTSNNISIAIFYY